MLVACLIKNYFVYHLPTRGRVGVKLGNAVPTVASGDGGLAGLTGEPSGDASLALPFTEDLGLRGAMYVFANTLNSISSSSLVGAVC